MKKIRLLIATIYIVLLLIITLTDSFFIIKSVINGSNKYFKKVELQSMPSLSNGEINQTINLLKYFNQL
ncbi:MAG: hypothetical protein KatS3mg097_027 [Candidatus Parcubacteria bacterium]|nr:MAG: hypothetical protein KatS3mg097_027 [Candidatus Parcubacteria bacterium]